MNVRLRNIDEIKPYDKNPRKNDGAVDAVAASLREFGFRQPMALSLDQVARVLGVKLEVIHNHVERGAPTASDGTMSLVHYAAWLNQQISKAGS